MTKAPATILVVDDDPSMRTVLRGFLEERGHAVTEAAGGAACLEALARRARQADGAPFELVVTDLKMEPMDGLALLREIQARDHRVTTVMMTAHGTIQTAVEAMRLGAFDYLLKPFTFDAIDRVISAALETHRRRQRDLYVPPSLDASGRLDSLVGSSAAMQEVYRAIRRVAATAATVLITGETGTGKELVARAIHNLGDRREKPFVAVNCAALAPALLESELFGHEKGAFTGAGQTHIGRFELADRGTIFLDEIGEMEPLCQTKFLRVLQERVLERVGGIRTIEVDVRVVAATNVDLGTACGEGRFREDLYYRLNVFPIALPPLRERVEDIGSLAAHFVHQHCETLGVPVEGITDAAVAVLEAMPWPGNVRELENVIQRAMILAAGDRIEPADLPPPSGDAVAPAERTRGGKLRHVADRAAREAERRALSEALEAERGNVTRTARRLGISRTTLQERMKRYGLRKPR